jgi:hypothetical protein
MNLNKKTPNFIIVGTAKAGTSFLLKYLRQHPNLFIPNSNELYFHSNLKNFAGPFDKDIEIKQIRYFKEYIKNFKESNREEVIGEFATDYLYCYKNSIKSIKKNIGEDVKIVIILRNPIERTFSHYKHMVSKFQEPFNFWDAINAQNKRKQKKWRWAYQYTGISKYFNQVKAFKENFKNVHVIIHEDLKKDPKKTINILYRFLKIKKKHFKNIKDKVNVKIITKYKFISSFLFYLKLFEKKLFKSNKIISKIESKISLDISLSNQDKEKLYKFFFKDDISKLEKFLKINLNHWRYKKT